MHLITDLIPLNPYSRPGTHLEVVKNVVVHYVGNPGSTAKNNRDYFANQPAFAKLGKARYVSSHYVIGIDGEVIQCVPEDEIAYCSNAANSYSISIECCHPDSSGQFTSFTRSSLVELLVQLCKRYELTSEDIIRHYDVNGKKCPLYYVVHPDEWRNLKADVSAQLSSITTLYYVQVGAFEYKENAEDMVKRLSDKGFSSFIREVER